MECVPSTSPPAGVLITGASGLLGRALFAEFKDAGTHDPVIGTAFSRVGPGLVKVDLTDPAACTALVTSHRPAVVVHAAAERRPDKVAANPDAVTALNVHCTYTLARAAAEIGAAFIHISTDYVFDGSSPPYAPGDAPKPLNAYGVSKLRAEYAALAAHPSAVVLRVPVLYGPCASVGESAVTLLHGVAAAAKEAAQEAAGAVAAGKDPPTPQQQRADAWAVRSPTFTPDIARVVRRLSGVVLEGGVSGILHWSSDVTCTKYDMALGMAQLLASGPGSVGGGAEAVQQVLVPTHTPPPGAPRPRDVTLDVTALLDLGVHAGVDKEEGGGVKGTPSSSSPRGVPFLLGLRAALASAGIPVVSLQQAEGLTLTSTLSHAGAAPGAGEGGS